MTFKTQTYDHKRTRQHFGLEDVDKAFFNWFDKKLNYHTTNTKNENIKVPVVFVTAERWKKAREGGIRNKDGTLVLPIIAIARPTEKNSNDGSSTSRFFAETKQQHAYAIEVSPKSSKVKNLLENRPYDVDPTRPIYEMHTFETPDHYELIYNVKIWMPYMTDANSFIQKMGHEFDFRSQKSFKFSMPDGHYFVAYQDEDFNDGSNVEDYSDDERIIKKEFSFSVSAHILPESDERESGYRRYWTQSRIVIKKDFALTDEEYKELIGEK